MPLMSHGSADPSMVWWAVTMALGLLVVTVVVLIFATLNNRVESRPEPTRLHHPTQRNRRRGVIPFPGPLTRRERARHLGKSSQPGLPRGRTVVRLSKYHRHRGPHAG